MKPTQQGWAVLSIGVVFVLGAVLGAGGVMRPATAATRHEGKAVIKEYLSNLEAELRSSRKVQKALARAAVSNDPCAQEAADDALAEVAYFTAEQVWSETTDALEECLENNGGTMTCCGGE